MKYPLYIVSGAPAAGKSATLRALLKLHTDYLAFDIDWLSRHAWHEVLHAIYQNNKVPLLFAPFDKEAIDSYGLPEWCSEVRWLLLDCDDGVRSQRLEARGWSDERIAEAMSAAQKLRSLITDRIDTAVHGPAPAAHQVLAWVEHNRA